MRVLINQTPHELPNGATLRDAVAALGLVGPFAAAINLVFVPRSQYEHTALQEGDQLELIAPVTGG